ncbi:MAG: element excision factor XisH family protein [Leptolyngbyaceae cyanobacterium]
MSTKDRFHNTVKAALVKDGWKITHDPLFLDFDNTRIQIDLAGEKLIAAERGAQKIAVEIKSFLGASTIYEFHLAIGQCFSYRIALRVQEPERKLYPAVPEFTYREFFRRPFASQVLQESQMSVIAYDPAQEVILEWIN